MRVFVAGATGALGVPVVMTGRVTMSNAKSKSELGWTPRYPSVREGLSGMSRSQA